MTPRVTFLLPVHNSAATVGATIESILAQTFGDFELLVIDDASTDASPDILRSFADSRIRRVRNETRLELTATLNRGLALSQTEYIARIDADDLCLPQRAAVQAAYLDAHPQVGVVGSFIETFRDDPSLPTGITKYPLGHAAIAASLIFRCSLAHPAVMIRKAALMRYSLRYDESFRRSQDYDLWSRCHANGVMLANIPEVLLRYRMHAAQATNQDSANSLGAAAKVRLNLLRHLGLEPDSEQRRIHERLSLDQLVATAEFISDANHWMINLATANERLPAFDREAFLRVLTGRFVSLQRFAKANGVAVMDPARTPFASFIYPGSV